MENWILIAILAGLILGAAAYIRKAKKRGVKCVGCNACTGCCHSCTGCEKK